MMMREIVLVTCSPGTRGPGNTLPAPPEAGALVLAVVLVAGVAAPVEEGPLGPTPGGDLAPSCLTDTASVRQVVAEAGLLVTVGPHGALLGQAQAQHEGDQHCQHHIVLLLTIDIKPDIFIVSVLNGNWSVPSQTNWFDITWFMILAGLCHLGEPLHSSKIS